MKLLKKSVTTFLVGLFLVGVFSNAQAQDRRSVIKLYNQGIEQKQAGEFDQAISTFNRVITTAQKSEENNDIVGRSEQQLADTYFKRGVSRYKQLQKNQSLEDFDATISAFEEAKEIAEKYNSSKIASKVSQIIPQLYYNKGVLAYKRTNLEQSLEALNEAVNLNSNYANAYYQRGLVKKKMDGVSEDSLISAFETSLQIGEKTNNNSVVRESKSQLGGIYLTRGHRLVSEQKAFERGIEAYDKALEYTPESAQLYFRLAEAHNELQNWEQASEYAQQGLEYETGGRTDQAKYYFELGIAYKGMGQKEQACSAFGNAAYGNFKSSAEHEMEYQLECESATN